MKEILAYRRAGPAAPLAGIRRLRFEGQAKRREHAQDTKYAIPRNAAQDAKYLSHAMLHETRSTLSPAMLHETRRTLSPQCSPSLEALPPKKYHTNPEISPSKCTTQTPPPSSAAGGGAGQARPSPPPPQGVLGDAREALFERQACA